MCEPPVKQNREHAVCMNRDPLQIDRGRTAIGRAGFSRPIRLAVEMGILPPCSTIFDYGCGDGDDLQRLRAAGYVADGWDPNHRPSARRESADVVNLGYVINAIEDPTERAEALRAAWLLCQRVLVIAARLEHDADGERFREFRDGY